VAVAAWVVAVAAVAAVTVRLTDEDAVEDAVDDPLVFVAAVTVAAALEAEALASCAAM
jgi:hypothetical protein